MGHSNKLLIGRLRGSEIGAFPTEARSVGTDVNLLIIHIEQLALISQSRWISMGVAYLEMDSLHGIC